MVSFGDAIKMFFNKAFDFRTRSTRAEYWWVVVFLVLASIPISILGIIVSAIISPILGLLLMGIFYLGTGVLSISLTVRRLHDIGRSGLWYLGFVLVNAVLSGISSYYAVEAFGDFLAYSNASGLEQLQVEGTPLLAGISFVQAALNIALFVCTVLPSQQGVNKWGGNIMGGQSYSSPYVPAPQGAYNQQPNVVSGQSNGYSLPLDSSLAQATSFPIPAPDVVDYAPAVNPGPVVPVYPPGHPLAGRNVTPEQPASGYVRPVTEREEIEIADDGSRSSSKKKKEPAALPVSNFNPPALTENPFS